MAKKNMTSLLVGFTILFFLTKYVLSFQPSSRKLLSQTNLRTNIALFIYVFSGHQTPFCCVAHNFVFRQESGSCTACFIPPYAVTLQIMITSCKAICFETLCWWPPMFDWDHGLLMMNFPNPLLFGGMQRKNVSPSSSFLFSSSIQPHICQSM